MCSEFGRGGSTVTTMTMTGRTSQDRAPLLAVAMKKESPPEAGARAKMPRWTDANRSDVPDERNDAPASVVQLLNTMIGSGILSFPYVFANVGWVLSLILLAASGLRCYVTSSMLLAAAGAVGRPRGEYSEVVEDILGSRWRKVVDICVASSCLGALLTYYNVIGALGSDLLVGTRHADGDELIIIDTYAGFMVIVVTVCAVPWCFMRTYGELAPISFGSLLFISAVTAIVAGKGVAGGKAIPAGPKSWYAPVSCAGNFVYATGMEYAVMEAHASMRPESRSKVQSVLARSIFGGCLLLGAMGVAGVAACGVGVDSDVLTSLNKDATTMRILYALTITHLVLYIPNDFILGRLFFWRAWNVNYNQMPEQRHLITTALFAFAPLALMASIPRNAVDGAFQFVVAFTGAGPAVVSTFLAPCLLYKAAVLDSTVPRDEPFSRATTYGLIAAASLILVVAPAVAVVDFASTCRIGCSSHR